MVRASPRSTLHGAAPATRPCRPAARGRRRCRPAARRAPPPIMPRIMKTRPTHIRKNGQEQHGPGQAAAGPGRGRRRPRAGRGPPASAPHHLVRRRHEQHEEEEDESQPRGQSRHREVVIACRPRSDRVGITPCESGARSDARGSSVVVTQDGAHRPRGLDRPLARGRPSSGRAPRSRGRGPGAAGQQGRLLEAVDRADTVPWPDVALGHVTSTVLPGDEPLVYRLDQGSRIQR